MVKLDVRRDYYADLALAPSADHEDVKKQFRKLALKYHPDRNPGKELEFNARFQAIQAAHEILSDPHQRLKYDTERLRNGYYGPPKPSSARKDSAAGYPTAKPNTKATFSERPKSFHHGPSSGAQRYASYARAAPKQPWEKMRDETQTRADAYRGFQEMKGNAMPGWSSFDPRGRGGPPGTVPKPTGTPNGSSARPKSAYEYVHTGAKPTTAESAHAQSAKKKGFAPRAAAGGDEPMAANTASYRNAPRFDRFTPAPSPTSRKPAAGFSGGADNVNSPEYEKPSSKYASTGGERTFFSSSMLGRSGSTRTSPKNPSSRPRTNPPSPTPQESGRHRSASPSLKADRNRDYDWTSPSDLSEDEVQFKPKAMPKSKLQQQQKFANIRTTNGWTAHDSDSASSVRNNSDTPVFSKKADFSFESRNFAQNGAFKSSSHDDLRKSSRREQFGYPETQSPNDRGRASTRDSPPRAAGSSSKHASRSGSASQQQQMPFAQESFLNNNWEAAFQFRDLSDALPTNDNAKSTNSQRTRSPRKPTRPAPRTRTTPQQASVATEAEEAESTVNDPYLDGEAMDLDEETPAKSTVTTPAAPKRSGSKPKTAIPSKARTTSKSGGKSGASNPMNLNTLSGVFPFTSTNSGGLEDLKDISSTLPFDSRAKGPKTTMRGTHPKELVCPNPPKRPDPPQPVPISAGSKQIAIPRAAMDRYIAEMNTYVREWEGFNGRMVGHFISRHTSNETEMAPNWLGAIGDSIRLSDEEARNSGDESDDNTYPTGKPPARRGFTSYKNALVQDEKVMKHWEVARERHLECISKYGQMRDWIRGGGKIL
ncbi:hypothetical protein BDW59DRAFT_102497 [Aspergillus cavernicola]|uniref:J domain-containing protein n=1 Tax=Aspergillus cavernicola TaxID=176166 RepID=A0ABR4I3G8_9EURO